jgi:hypothetical protein
LPTRFSGRQTLSQIAFGEDIDVCGQFLIEFALQFALLKQRKQSR